MDDAGGWNQSASADLQRAQFAAELELEVNIENRRRITVKEHYVKRIALAIALAGFILLNACAKKVAPPPPPAAPQMASPTASISVNPTTVAQGQSAALTWQTSNATDVSIDGIGAVQPTGLQQVSPAESTTYHLTAKGAGGTQDATVRLTVTPPVAQAPPPAAPNLTEEQLFASSIKDVYFDYDKADIRPDQQAAVQGDTTFLAQHSGINFTIEGYCDERGSTEYNIALGDRRAASAKSALVQAGITSSRIKTISYGKEKPFCTESTEACWQQNRRGHFVYQK
jgi:peptidoglycan-associated lipoprotein